MTAWVSWTAKTIMLAAGFAVVAGGGFATAAFAGTGGGAVTSGLGSVLGGNQVKIPVTVPVDVCGNSVAVLGIAGAGCEGGSVVKQSAACGCPGNVKLLPVISRPAAGLTSYDIRGVGHPARLARQLSLRKAGLGELPAVGGLPSLAGLTRLTQLASDPAAGMLMPRASLSSANGGGMSDTTFFTLAGGVLLAGISALKMSSRRGTRRNVRGMA